ncbi:MAG: hypothetical protein IJH25_00255, partial [Clostridia bacterium]|nr:hypothetical protein [Clostridia bacterium]
MLNDGRLEQVTVGSDGKFAINIEPMMWKYAKDGSDHYLQHESYARTVTGDRRAETWYYSYINPNADDGFSDPWVCTPMHDDLRKEWKEEYKAEHPGCSEAEVDQYAQAKEAEYNTKFAIYDEDTEDIKNDSKIALVNIGGKYYIKSATTGSFIGVDGGAMKGNVDSANAAEVFFADAGNITTWTGYNQFERMARHHVVEHIDIGVNGKAELHVPLPADTYFDKEGNPIVVPSHTVLRVKADVPIDSQDIKNAKLTAFQYGPNGEKIVVADAYYITGYSGNAPTSISAAQVRYEGQFKVAWEDGRDPAHKNGGADKDNTIPDNIDPYEGDEEWRKWRLEHQVYYNVNLTKQVTFELEYNGTKLYSAAGKQLVSKVPVELSGSFSYWDPNNECPAIHDDFNTDNGYWHAGHYGDPAPRGWESIGWRDENDANKKINGIIPHAAWGNSGMDFILGGSKDQTAVVITKFIEDESGNVIHLQSETASKVKVLQKDIDAGNPKSETDKVKEKYIVRNTDTNDPALSTVYDGNYRVYGEAQRNIVVGVEGYGTIYDFDVRRGMVGVEEIRAQEGGFPEVVTDADGNQWEYVHTYIRTDYVTRKNGDTQDKYHYTKNYTKADTNYLSVPEVLGPYKRDDEYYDEDLKQNTYDDNSDFLEFYIHNVYKPRKIQVEVEKEWKQGSRTIDPPSDARVQVPLKRYKLVPKEEFHQATDKYLKAQVNVYRENYIPKKTLYRNGSDFHARDTLTVTLEYTFNAESVRYRVNGQDYVVCPTFPDGPEPEAAVNNNHRLRYAFDVTVPEDGELTVDVDDNWTCASVASVTVKACNHGNGSQGTGSGSATESENVDGVPVPPSPADKPNMVYTVDTSWAGETISLPGEAWNGSVWKGKSGDLDAYDEKGNAYLYFIDEAGVTEENVPAGTMKFVGRASNGAYLTSTGFYYDPSTQQIVATEDNETLKVVNQVPATVKLLKKDAQTQQDLVGARFALYRLETTGWAMIEDIDMSSNSSATIPELYDGRYKLEEVESPTEHKVLDNAMYFRVRNGEASLTNENGSAYTPSLDDNLIQLNGSALTVKNTPDGKLEISTTVTSVSNATGQDFTFTVTLKNIDDSAYTGTATLTDKTHNAERVTVGNGTLTVVITGTGTATIDNLPVGTKFEVVETEANGWSQVSSEWRHNGVVQEDTTPKVIAKGVTDAVTFTNTQLGTLQITKLVRLDGQQPSGDDIGIADGTYTFTVAGPSPATAVLKYVQIKVENGVATSHRIADTEEALGSTEWITSAIAVLENLVVGDYVITETDRGQLALTDIAGGKQIQKEGQAPHNDADLTAGTVTVTVASGTIAQADVTYTNSMFKATINILKIDETTRQNDTPTRLSKAKFTLKKWNGTSTYEPMETKTTEDATGTLSFTGLSNGEYKIEEDETPPGFVMVENNDIYFSVENGVVKRFDKGVDQTDRKEIPSQVITNPGNESESETKDVVIAKISYSTDASTHRAQFIVGNTPGARLPSTGGHGT